MKRAKNTRETDKGVEQQAVPQSSEESGKDREPATGLIGDGKMTDPRYLAQR